MVMRNKEREREIDNQLQYTKKQAKFQCFRSQIKELYRQFIY